MNKDNIIILASHNAGKVKELQSAFEPTGFRVENLDFLPFPVEDVEETGQTFEENALLKARYVAEKTGYISLADDSGLEIESLNNAPGVYSARYAQKRNDLINELTTTAHPSKDELNILQVLKDMASYKDTEQRKARFCCCLALVFPKTNKELLAYGYWNGYITKEKIGENGFGYDPIFYDNDLKKTAAQLSKEEKLKVSHRGKAVANLIKQIG